VETIESIVLACCALHNLLRKKSVSHTSLECFDNENSMDGTLILFNLVQGVIPIYYTTSNDVQEVKFYKEQKLFEKSYVRISAGRVPWRSVPWQEKSALNV